MILFTDNGTFRVMNWTMITGDFRAKCGYFSLKLSSAPKLGIICHGSKEAI